MNHRRRIATLFLTVLLLAEVGVLGFAERAHAVVPVFDTATQQTFAIESIEDFLKVGLIGSLFTSMINAINYFGQRFAYDTAELISEGGPGKSSLFQNKSFGDYLRDTALDSVGEALGTLSESGLAPFNLCDPGIPSLKISLALGLIGDVQPPTPKCSWKQIVSSYEAFSQLGTQEVLSQFGTAFEPGQSSLGVTVESSSKIAVEAGKKLNAKLQERLEGGGFTSLNDTITGKIMTPATIVREQATEASVKEGKRVQDLSWSAYFQNIAVAPLATAGMAAVNTFVTHLLAKLLQKALGGDGLYYSLADVTCQLGITGCGGISDFEYGAADGLSQFRQRNADLITPPLQQDQRYSPIEEFSTCPDNGKGVNNCVIDSQLAAALSRGSFDGRWLTVREALEEGYLHADWPLISNSETHRARNADPYCFASSYCYANLVKLRKHRILPIGWEIAAAKSPADPVKLGEVIAKFDDCPTADDPNPGAHPWCHLIDPNWVIKLPITHCRLRVNGPTLISDEAPARAQVCADTPSCIAEDGNGNCVQGYGYCVREKNIWRLGGTECQAPYASCASFASRTGESLLALQTTIDHGVCNADNVGCRPYSLTRHATNTAAWYSPPGKDRVFLNSSAATCDAEDAGCTRLVDKEGLSRNLVPNSSFEEAAGEAANQPKYWGERWWDPAVVWLDDSSLARSGRHAVIPTDDNAVKLFTSPFMRIPVESDQTYTVSFYVRKKTPEAASGNLIFYGHLSEPNENLVNVAGELVTGCTIEAKWGKNAMKRTVTPADDGSWTRANCTVVVPPKGANDPILFTPVNIASLYITFIKTGPDVIIDDIKVEEGPFTTAYHEASFQGGSTKALKISPEYLGCTGEKGKDSPSCAQYAPVCRADEVGCNRYTPELGGTPITAVTASNDSCPAECVGYETFREERSLYDLEAYPKYFIPTTASQCSVTAAGCTEFTNLDTQAAGGEAREYFTYLRSCEKPAGGIPTFYTWEGSDTTGFQLKEWHLKAGTPFAGELGSPPATVSDYEQGLCTKSIFSSALVPDCREFFDIDGNVSYRLYSKTIVVSDQCHPYRITKSPAVETATTEAACAAFGVGYHWQNASNRCLVCEPIGGAWDAAGSECLFEGLRAESAICQNTQNGCRLYTGNAGANVQVLLNESFEGAAFLGWDAALGQANGVVATSTESTVVGGRSLRVKGAASAWREMATSTTNGLEEKGIYFLQFWAKGPAASVQVAQLRNPATGQASSFLKPSSPVVLNGNWNLYTLGPTVLSFDPNDPGGVVHLEFQAGVASSQSWFIDNIELRKSGSAVAVVEDSWNTPNSCNRTSSGVFLPQAQLGCAAYSDRKDGRITLKSFDHLCRDAAVGCRAFVDTRNNDFSGYEYWNAMAVNYGASGTTPVSISTGLKGEGGVEVCTAATNTASCRYAKTSMQPPSELYVGGLVNCKRSGAGPCSIDGVYICTAGSTGACLANPSDLVTVLPDRTVYVVDDEAFSCDSSAIGCSEVGLATGSVCTLASTCAPTSGASTCACQADVEVCTAPGTCSLNKQFVCNVAAGGKTCTYSLPKSEPYGGLTYATEHRIVNPAQFAGQVCTGNAVGCESWRSTNLNAPALSYFKSPDGRLCEYREGVKVNNIETSGYYRQGTNEPCDPTYLVNGNYYGIRKDADQNYQGFVGMCPGSQASCTEYIDPTDLKVVKSADGKPTLLEPQRYYYIKDKTVDYASCKGQVSQKEGCVLLNDTSDLNFSYNTAGSNNDSTAKQFALTQAKPGVCQYSFQCSQILSGTESVPQGMGPGHLRTVDFEEYFDELGGTWPLPESFGSEQFSPQYEDVQQYPKGFTNATLTSLCSTPSVGVLQAAIYEERGCVTDADCMGGVGRCRLDKKDTNAVIRVDRDRVCGAWFACKSSTPQWDPRTNRFRETCDEIGLCDESSLADSSSPTVDTTTCKSWVTDTASQKILSEAVYRNRDISWTGQEFSGYSIPHMYSAHVLSQATLGKVCNDPEMTSCESSADCPYLDPGETSKGRYSCQPLTSLGKDVGSCDANNGSPCCTGGSCPVKQINGVCYEHRCFFSPYGNSAPDKLDAPQGLKAVSKIPLSCRAYPESDSPVPPEVVTTWSANDPTLPGEVRQGFQQAKVCQDGQDCECSYKKSTYEGSQFGQPGARYFGQGNKPEDTVPGICSGGPYNGMKCDPDGGDLFDKRDVSTGKFSCSDQDIDASLGSQPPYACQPLARTDLVRGLEGYCLERDTATPIYGRETGSPDSPARACYTWLPVDRLSGTPDIYNLYTSATFSTQSSYACLVPQLYKTVHTYGLGDDPNDEDIGSEVVTDTDDDENDDGAAFVKPELTGSGFGVWLGCASRDDTEVVAGVVTTGNNLDIWKGFPEAEESILGSRGTGNIFLDCPPSTGFIVVSSNLDEADGDEACFGGGVGDPDNEFCDGGDTDDTNFPYICVPWGSVHMEGSDKNTECTPGEILSSAGAGWRFYPHGVCNLSDSLNWDGTSPAPTWNKMASEVNSFPLCHTFNEKFFPRFREQFWPEENSPRDWASRTNQDEDWNLQEGDMTPVLVVEKICAAPITKYSDCVKLDAPVTNTASKPYWGATRHATGDGVNAQKTSQTLGLGGSSNVPLGAYMGCSVLAKISSDLDYGDDVNKALIERTDGSQTTTEVAPSYTLNTSNPETNYKWNQAPSPFGLGLIPTFSKPAPAPSSDVKDLKPDALQPYIYVSKTGGTICDASTDGCYTYKNDASGLPDAAHITKGWSRASQLFAKAYDYLGWSFAWEKNSNNKIRPLGYKQLPEYLKVVNSTTYAAIDDYEDLKDVNSFNPLFIDDSLSAGTVRFPQIWSPGSCDVDNRCLEKTNGRFTVNDLDSGVIVGGGGWKHATFKFFADAGFQTEPIRDVRVIWNVNSPNIPEENSGQFIGFFKNHRGYEVKNEERVSKCDGTEFGNSSDACEDDAPLIFIHNYTCNASSPHCEDGTDICWTDNANNSGKPGCVYEPAVYVLNNWGLCAGTCPGGLAGNACSNGGSNDANVLPNASAFEPSNATPKDECDLEQGDINAGLKPFIQSSVDIIVFPEE